MAYDRPDDSQKPTLIFQFIKAGGDWQSTNLHSKPKSVSLCPESALGPVYLLNRADSDLEPKTIGEGTAEDCSLR